MTQIIQTSTSGLNLSVSVTVPLPPLPTVGLPKIALPVITLPQIPDLLGWLGAHLQALMALIKKLIDMIPEASVRLRIYIQSSAVKTKIFDETVAI